MDSFWTVHSTPPRAGGTCYNDPIHIKEESMSSPKFKFPRLEAGLYRVVMDKVDVGLIQKEVDGKEVSWWIHNTITPDEIGAMTSVGNPDDLLREAKDTAQKYFTNQPKVEVKTPQQTQEPVVEEKGILDNLEEDFFDSLNEFEELEKELVNV